MGLVKATAIAVAVTMPAIRPDRTRNVRAVFDLEKLLVPKAKEILK